MKHELLYILIQFIIKKVQMNAQQNKYKQTIYQTTNMIQKCRELLNQNNYQSYKSDHILYQDPIFISNIIPTTESKKSVISLKPKRSQKTQSIMKKNEIKIIPPFLNNFTQEIPEQDIFQKCIDQLQSIKHEKLVQTKKSCKLISTQKNKSNFQKNVQWQCSTRINAGQIRRKYEKINEDSQKNQNFMVKQIIQHNIRSLQKKKYNDNIRRDNHCIKNSSISKQKTTLFAQTPKNGCGNEFKHHYRTNTQLTDYNFNMTKYINDSFCTQKQQKRTSQYFTNSAKQKKSFDRLKTQYLLRQSPKKSLIKKVQNRHDLMNKNSNRKANISKSKSKSAKKNISKSPEIIYTQVKKLQKLKDYKFVTQYLTHKQLQTFMSKYIQARVPQQRWSLMIIDQVYKKMKSKK